MASLVLSLPDITPADLPETGGKAAGLARLARLGLPVPPALAVTASFFEEVRSRFPDEPEIESLALRIPPALARELEAGLDRLGGAPHGYAVRSSAAEEDGKAGSFAGVHDSFLRVPRGEIPSALFRCWASAFSPRASAYRRGRGLPAETSAIRMGVVVQVMLEPSVAGVLFTREPGAAGGALLIQAAPGSGEDLVQGRIRPVTFRLPREGSAAFEGTPEDVSPLSEEVLRDLAAMALAAEAEWEAPLDLEWAAEGGRIFLLQARAIAAPRSTAGAADPGLPSPEDSLWTRASLRELLPDLPSVFFVSLMERLDWGDLLRRVGLPAPAGRMLRVVQGRPYLNLSLVGAVLEELGLGASRALGQDSAALGLPGREAHPLRALLLHPVRHLRLRRRMARAPREALAFFDRAHERSRGLRREAPERLDDAGLLERLREMEAHHREFLALLLSGFCRASFRMLAAERLLPSETNPDGFINAVLGAGEGNVSVRQGLDLLRLGKLARREGRVVQYLLEGKEEYRRYEEELEGTEFLPAFRGYLAEYGHRGVQEADPATPLYGEEPGLLLKAISVAAADPLSPDPEGLSRSRREAAASAWRELRGGLPWLERLLPLRLILLRGALGRLRRAAALRERIRFEGTRVNAELRRFLKETGRRLRERRILEEDEDVFLLKLGELETALSGGSGGAGLLETLPRRREERRAQAAIPMPEFLRESEIPTLGAAKETGLQEEGTFRGLPVGPGRVEGRVTVLEGPHQADRVRRGDILVAPTLDPSWIPLFTLASGLVVETGGTLSHGSLLVREYGLPAVTNLPGITRKLRSGERVLLDGSAGVVRRLAG